MSYLLVTLGLTVLHSILPGNQGLWPSSTTNPVPKSPRTSLIPASPLIVQSLSHVRLFATHGLQTHTPGFPVHHIPEFAQTHVHWVNNAI